jgi:hypothetical protein
MFAEMVFQALSMRSSNPLGWSALPIYHFFPGEVLSYAEEQRQWRAREKRSKDILGHAAKQESHGGIARFVVKGCGLLGESGHTVRYSIKLRNRAVGWHHRSLREISGKISRGWDGRDLYALRRGGLPRTAKKRKRQGFTRLLSESILHSSEMLMLDHAGCSHGISLPTSGPQPWDTAIHAPRMPFWSRSTKYRLGDGE